jgi:hypothetical protein
MKGVLFNQFLRFAEDQFGQEAARGVGGTARYSPGGDYDHRELPELARRLGVATGHSPGEILVRFGSTLFDYFAQMYPVFFAGVDSALSFLSRIETSIHGELLKLYPGAQFPHFDVSQPSVDRLEMVYRSRRGLADLAEGLIRGCAKHFGESIEVRREAVAAAGGQAVRFVLVAAGPGTPPPRGEPSAR